MLSESEKSEARRMREFVYREDAAKRAWKGRFLVNRAFYMGLYHFYLNPDTTWLDYDPTLINGYIQVPIFRESVDRMASAIMGDKFSWRASQTGGTQDDAQAALGATLFLQGIESANSVHLNNVLIATTLLVAGNAFKRLYIEDDWVPVEMPGELFPRWLEMKNDANIKSGKPPVRIRDVMPSTYGNIKAFCTLPVIREQCVPPTSVVIETGARCLRDSTKFAVHELRPVDWVRQNYPGIDEKYLTGEIVSDKNAASPAGMTGAMRQNSGGDQQTGDMFSPGARLMHLYNTFERMQDGRYQQVIYARQGFDVILDAKTVDFTDLVEYQSFKIDTDVFWCNALCDGIVDLQRHFARNVLGIIESFTAAVKEPIILPRSERNNLTNDYSPVLYEDSRNKGMIRRLPMSNGVIQASMAIAETFKGLMYEAMGIGDAMRGVTKTHVTAEGLKLTQQSDQSKLATLRKYIEDGEKDKLRKALMFARDPELFDEPRWIAMRGNESGMTIARAIRGADFAGISDVEIVDSIELPNDPAARLEWGIQLANAGLFQDPNALKDFLRLGTGILPQESDEQIERAKALTIIEMIKRGYIMPGPAKMQEDPQTGEVVQSPGPMVFMAQTPMNGYSPGDMIIRREDIQSIHIEELTRSLRLSEYDPMKRQIAEMLVMERIQIVQAEEQQAKASEIEMQVANSMATQAAQIEMQLANARLKMAGEGIAATKAIPAA